MKILFAGTGAKAQYGSLLTGHYSVEFISGDAASLQDAGKTPYACLIVTDACSNVFSLISSLRLSGNQSPVMCILHHGGAEERIRALSAGADDCMTMPGNLPELKARIDALLRRRETYTPAALSYCGLTLDPLRSSMSANGTLLSLTRMEYQIMQLFISSPGVNFTAAEILARVWASTSPADVNTVWVYISRLRKKLTEMGSSAVIHSRRGLGYALCEA